MKTTQAVVGMGLVALATGLISLLSVASQSTPAPTPPQTSGEIPGPVSRVLSEFGMPMVTDPAGTP